MNRTFVQEMSVSNGALFTTAAEALDAAAAFERTTSKTFQYEIEAKINYDGTALSVIGFYARIKDADGFGAGYVTEVLSDKLRAMQNGINEFVEHLQSTGQHDEAAKIAALLALPAKDVERIYDALTSGLSKAEFIEKIEAESGANISKGFAPAQPTEGA